jgi:hypothetical protein
MRGCLHDADACLCFPQLKAKKTEFEGMNEEEKKAHKKKVQQAKNNSNKVRGSKGRE